MTDLPCPDDECGRPLPTGATSCPACGLPLAGPVAAELWNVDRRLVMLQQRRAVLLTALRAGAVARPPGAAPGLPPHLPRQLSRPRPSGQQVLLGLGVAALLAAAIVFLAVAWNILGAVGQVTIMAALTAAAGAGVRPLARRGLGSSAEALALLFGGLAVVDAVAARDLDVAGLGAVDSARYGLGVAVVLAVVLAAGARWQRGVRAIPAMAVVGAGLAPLLLADVIDVGAAGASVIALVAAAGLGGVLARVRLPQPARALAPAGGAGYAVGAALLGAFAVADSPVGAGTAEGVVVLVALAVAGGVARLRRVGAPSGVGLGVTATSVAVLVTAAASHGGAGDCAIAAAVAFALAAALTVPPVPARRGDALVVVWTVGVLALVAAGSSWETARGPLTAALLVAAVALVGVAWRFVSGRPATSPGAVAVAALAVVVGARSSLWQAALLVVVAVVAVVVAGRCSGGSLEGPVAAVGVAVALAATAPAALAGTVALAAVFVVAALTAFGYAFLPDRGRVALIGVACLSAANGTLVHGNGVHTVEAYSLPVAVLLAVVAVVRLRREPGAPSWATVGPVCSAALVPSTAVAVFAPDSPFLRAALVLVAGAVVCAVGVWRRWQAPTVVGAAAVVLVILEELGPVAAGLPHWVTLGCVGALLLGLGVRYEQRLRELRRAAVWVGAMR